MWVSLVLPRKRRGGRGAVGGGGGPRGGRRRRPSGLGGCPCFGGGTGGGVEARSGWGGPRRASGSCRFGDGEARFRASRDSRFGSGEQWFRQDEQRSRQGRSSVPGRGEQRSTPRGCPRHRALRHPCAVLRPTPLSSQIAEQQSQPAMDRSETATSARCGMPCWKAAGSRTRAAAGRTRPKYPLKPSRPGFSRPGPLREVPNAAVIFQG